ncbi:MAG: DNA/RNA non-specific endonuclease [Lachnospiraceae bacterium]|jgi:DNA-entry nuclease|nr:DNA/RNA non-specific endonuclease [Lachnospiraceae bacterium]
MSRNNGVKRKHKKILPIIIIVLLLFAVLCSCGKSDTGSKPKEKAKVETNVSNTKKDEVKDTSTDKEQTSVSSQKATTNNTQKSVTKTSKYKNKLLTAFANQKPLSFKKKRQMVMKQLDSLGRAIDSHIQLKNSDEPNKKREQLDYDPVGWHNYRFFYKKSSTSTPKAWLMSRGHLVGYQFSGLNDEARNLVPETAWLNAGNYTGMNDNNKYSMLYYENRLDDWLSENPSSYLDYQVTPLYYKNELLPRQIRLAYIGYKNDGSKIKITLGGREEAGDYGATVVYLNNTSPNAKINYATGTAVNTVKNIRSNANANNTSKNQSVNNSNTSSGSQTVYVTGGGSSDVYWFSKDNMPSNTNMNNIVTMTEQEAKDQGKRHSLKD